MPPLTDIGKYKRLADLYVLALKQDQAISAAKNNEALQCLMEYGLTERQAESFLNDAFDRVGRGMIRSVEQAINDVSICFRRREHPLILNQIQSILEAGTISSEVQDFFDLCCKYLYHSD